MGCYLVPSYIKPYSKILSWTVSMGYIEEERQEYISDLKVVTPYLKGETRYFPKYEKLTMRTDMRGNPEQYKILPDVSSQILVPIEDFVEKVTESKEHGRMRGEVDVLTNKGIELIEQVYNMLDSDLRAVISLPLQWLIYSRSEKLLSRLCWVLRVDGEITVRPYGVSGILLEVDKLTLDKVNSVSLKELKKNTLVRQRLNDHWRSLVASGQLTTELTSIEGLAESEETKEEESDKVGVVE